MHATKLVFALARGSRPTTRYQIQSRLLPSSTRAYAATPERNPQFAQLSSSDVEKFRSILGNENQVLTSSEDTAPYNSDWLQKYTGKSQLVLRPRTTKQVSEILAHCNERGVAVVPQGGNTGMVGGSVPVHDEIVISTSLMNSVLAFDGMSGVVTCQAGVVLQHLDDHLRDFDHTVPLDLGAKGSCQIGGNVSTNAGGIRLLRYGSLHGNVLGLEVVLPDGTILDNLSTLRKDNTGYDVKQLFIGAEGTLGIVTGVSLLCPPKPKSVNVAFLACPSYEHVLKTFREAKGDLGEILSAFEFEDRHSLEVVTEHITGARDPLSSPSPFYVLIETSGSVSEHDQEKLNSFLEKTMASGTVTDGVVAQDETQIRSLWTLRECLAEALAKAGAVYKYDLSIPVREMYDLVEEMRARIGTTGNVVGYGHLGDSNLHLNITVPKFCSEVEEIIEPFVYEFTSKRSGSVSAEHGVGLMKAPYLGYSKTQPMINLMKMMKASIDPKGIMNPYKVLSSD
eukprot:TRINITY_DN5266_c0_g1_i1.p1 TRINITY_DN5266_c0_g1~~TRINITY_DN5266_c0_g1_i1.p1  ORF type:complete len:509 (+),score=91.10 TRINITY_DN5266_c0_g1_i1:61-1587(+)